MGACACSCLGLGPETAAQPPRRVLQCWSVGPELHGIRAAGPIPYHNSDCICKCGIENLNLKVRTRRSWSIWSKANCSAGLHLCTRYMTRTRQRPMIERRFMLHDSAQ